MAKLKVGDVGLFEILVAVTVLIILVMATVNMRMKQQDTFDEVSFAMSKQNFTQNVAIIKGQWLLEGRPSQLQFNLFAQDNSITDNSLIITNTTTLLMSKNGWPSLIDSNQAQYCKVLWATISNLSLDADVIKNLIVKKEQKKDE